jgi:predicted Rdx family selenoprotein
VANEFFRTFGGDVGISLTPGANGRFEVYLDGEKIWDKRKPGTLPDLSIVRQLKGVIKAKIESLSLLTSRLSDHFATPSALPQVPGGAEGG